MNHKSKKPTHNVKTARHSSPSLRETPARWLIKDLCSYTAVAPWVKNSYVLSRTWAWISRVRVEPSVRIPVPRFFTNRDP